MSEKEIEKSLRFTADTVLRQDSGSLFRKNMVKSLTE